MVRESGDDPRFFLALYFEALFVLGLRRAHHFTGKAAAAVSLLCVRCHALVQRAALEAKGLMRRAHAVVALRCDYDRCQLPWVDVTAHGGKCSLRAVSLNFSMSIARPSLTARTPGKRPSMSLSMSLASSMT